MQAQAVHHDRHYWNMQLYEATLDNNLSVMQRAIAMGADVNFCKDERKAAPLHYAVHHTSRHHGFKAVEILLKAGADPNQANARGFTPLFVSAPQWDMSEMLLDYGANPNVYAALEENHPTPLSYAASLRAADLMRQLLEAGADSHCTYGVFGGLTLQELLPEAGNEHIKEMLESYEALPCVAVDDTLDKATLLQKDAAGYCALDNPVTWRHWPQITGILADRGEHFTKAELLQKAARQDAYLTVAAHARSLFAVVGDLNKRGETLEALEIADIGDMKPMLARPHLPAALFTFENMRNLGRERLLSNVQAVPEEGREYIGGFHRLIHEVSMESRRKEQRGGR